MKLARIGLVAPCGVVSALVAFVLVAALEQVGIAQVNPALLGEWKLNLAKSTFTPGPPPPSETRTYEQVGDGVKLTEETVRADGIRSTMVSTANYYGKDYPATGSLNFDTESLKRVDANTVEVTLKKTGKVVLTIWQVLSNDGRVLTITTTGTYSSGQLVHIVRVLDKQ